MKVITLLNEKGGVGKTTLATHIAAGLAIKGHKVVLVDTDPQGHSSVAFGLEKAPLLYNLLIYPKQMTFSQAMRPIHPEVYSTADNPVKGTLWVIPTDASARVIPMMTSDTGIVRKKFGEIADKVDYCIFDTAPTPSLLHGSIYMATDHIIYPTQPARLSFDGLAESIGRKDEVNSTRAEEGLAEIKIAGIVPTMVRPNTRAHEHAIKMLVDQFGERVWESVHQRTVWEQAQWAQRVLFNYAPETKAAAEAWGIVRRVEAVG